MTLQVPNSIPDMGELLPVPEDLDTWPTRMLELHRWMREDLAPGANLLASQAYDNAVVAMEAALSAIAAANFKGAWNSLTGAVAKPASASHSGTVWALLNNLADVTTSQPGVSADWVDIGGIKPSGGIMTGHLEGPAGATGNQYPRVSEVVTKAGAETIAGIKTFSASPVVPAGATGDQVPRADDMFGRAATWQTVTRTNATVYTNSTGKPIVLQAYGSQTTTSGYVLIRVNGQLAQFSNLASFAYATIGVSAVIPNGSTYAVEWSAMGAITSKEYK